MVAGPQVDRYEEIRRKLDSRERGTMARRSHAELLVVAVAFVAAACGSSTHSASSAKKHTELHPRRDVDDHDGQPAVVHDHCGSSTAAPSNSGGSKSAAATRAPAIATTTTTKAPAATTTTTTSADNGWVTVFAASSLTEAFQDEQQTLVGKYPSLHLTYSFSGSTTLVTQILAGAPADVVATADPVSMQQLVSAGLVDIADGVRQQPARDRRRCLAIPKHITGLADLANPALKVVIEDPSQTGGQVHGTGAGQSGHRCASGIRTAGREIDPGDGDVR